MPQTTPDGRQTCRGAVHGLRVTWGWLQHMPACPRPPWYRCRQPWQPFLPNCQPLPWASMAAKKNRAHTFGCAGAVRSSHAASRALAALSSLPRRGRVLYLYEMVLTFNPIELVFAFIYNILAEHLLRFISHLTGGTDRATGTPMNRSRCTGMH